MKKLRFRNRYKQLKNYVTLVLHRKYYVLRKGGINILVKNAIMFTTTEEDFNKILNDLNTKLQFLKANDFEYYTKAIEAWRNDVNELLVDVSIPESTRIRLGRLLEIINR